MLGVRVEAASLTSPTPGRFRLRQVTLADIETSDTLLAVERLDIHQAGQVTKLNAKGLSITNQQVSQVARCAHRLLTIDSPGEFSIEASDLSWLDDATAAEQQLFAGRILTAQLTELGGDDEPSGRQWEAALADLESPNQAIQLSITRNRQLSPPATRVSLDTSRASAPMSLVSQLARELPACGTDASFKGNAIMTVSNTAASGELTGDLRRVSLGKFCQLPVEAEGDVENFQMEWAGSRVISASGVARCNAGAMDGQLVAVMQRLYIEAQPAARYASLVTADEQFEFGQVGVQFSLNRQGLSLWGACTGGGESVAPLMVGTHKQVLFGRPDYLLRLPMVGEILVQHGGEQAANATACLPVPLVRR